MCIVEVYILFYVCNVCRTMFVTVYRCFLYILHQDSIKSSCLCIFCTLPINKKKLCGVYSQFLSIVVLWLIRVYFCLECWLERGIRIIFSIFEIYIIIYNMIHHELKICDIYSLFIMADSFAIVTCCRGFHGFSCATVCYIVCQHQEWWKPSKFGCQQQMLHCHHRCKW